MLKRKISWCQYGQFVFHIVRHFSNLWLSSWTSFWYFSFSCHGCHNHKNNDNRGNEYEQYYRYQHIMSQKSYSWPYSWVKKNNWVYKGFINYGSPFKISTSSMPWPKSPGAHLYDPASLSCTLWRMRQLTDMRGEFSDNMETPDFGVNMRSLCSHCVIFCWEGGLVTTQVRFKTLPTWKTICNIITQVYQLHTLTRCWWPPRILTEVSANKNNVLLCL